MTNYSNYTSTDFVERGGELSSMTYASYSYAAKFVNEKNLTTVLDIGCSNGYGYSIMKDECPMEYSGIDILPDCVERSKDHFVPEGSIWCHDVEEWLKANTKQYDLILCFNVLDQLDNGLEIAQKLKSFCKYLMVTVPYKGVEQTDKGNYYGPSKLNNLNFLSFPGFDKYFLNDNGAIVKQATTDCLKMFLIYSENTWEIEISSKDRYFTTLPLTIESILMSTILPRKITLFLDGEKTELNQNPLWQYLINLATLKGVWLDIFFSNQVGQTKNHEQARLAADSCFIARCDDDCIYEPDCFEKLLNVIKSDRNTGAVSPLVHIPNNGNATLFCPSFIDNKIESFGLNRHLNLQFFASKETKPIEVDYLHCTFMYRVSASSPYFFKEISKIGQQEETLFSYGIKRNGYRVLVNPTAKCFHLRFPSGGTRSDETTYEEMLSKDIDFFYSKLKEWGVVPQKYKFISASFGLGDCFCLASLLPEIQSWYNCPLLIATCRPEIFKGYKTIDLESGYILLNSFGINKYTTVYSFTNGLIREKGSKEKPKIFQGTLREAFLEFYKPKKEKDNEENNHNQLLL